MRPEAAGLQLETVGSHRQPSRLQFCAGRPRSTVICNNHLEASTRAHAHRERESYPFSLAWENSRWRWLSLQLLEKLERLQRLLLRVHMVVEEAEGRNITNSRMLIQLRMLIEAMYRGYYVLDTLKYKPFDEIRAQDESSSSYNLSFTNYVQRFSTGRTTVVSNELQSAVQTLESILTNMTEFVMLLGGYERMFHRPNDSYLYIDNFMFSRHVEKQQIINILLEKNAPDLGAPAVLPIIGGSRVGKKTLVAHVCNNEMVRSHFSSILHFNGDDVCSSMNGEKFMRVRTLVVIEFVSDVEDKDWVRFYLSATCMGKGSKIIIISRIEKLARFGTIKPICLSTLSHEEYNYLFKVLAFGSTNPDYHPRLASIAKELAMLVRGSFVPSNVIADMLRRNMNLQFWLHILKRYRNVVDDNFSVFGEHPKHLLDEDRPIDITKFASSCNAPLRLMPPCHDRDVLERELPKVMFGDLIAGSAVLPKGDFALVAWESRIPPYTKFINIATCAKEEPQYTTLPSKKRRR